jgi:hypothetical protein
LSNQETGASEHQVLLPTDHNGGPIPFEAISLLLAVDMVR